MFVFTSVLLSCIQVPLITHNQSQSKSFKSCFGKKKRLQRPFLSKQMQNIYQALFIKSHFPLQLCIFLYLKSEDILVGRKQTGLINRQTKKEEKELFTFCI